MIRIFRNTALIVLLMSLLLPACNRKEGTQGINREEAIEEALPVGQYMLSELHGVELTRLANIWTQHVAGVRGSYARLDQYDVDIDYLDESWERVFLYSNYHFDLVIRYASEINAYAYRGIARILQAYMFSITTDLFDDIPFEEAPLYFYAGRPKYDTQEEVYSGINDLILDGINDLHAAMSGNALIPGPDVDYFYQGDLDKWMKAANLLRLRTSHKISHHDGNYNHSLSVINEGGLLTGNQDNLFFPYNIHPDLPNPIYQFENNVRNVRVGKRIVDMLLAQNDPRLPAFVRRNTNQQYLGSGPGEHNLNASFLGPALASKTSPIYFLTYSEQKFLKAETYYKTGQPALAMQYFEEGIAASLDQFGVTNNNWLNNFINSIDELSLEDIMNAKYIAMFLNPESWADWRRNGYPELSLAENNVLDDQHPRRFPYPNIEYFDNADNVPENVSITDRVWWDVE